jgi:3-oxoadipate CoA-transferase beta subunit
VSATAQGLSRDQMAARVARDIPDGWYVNLGLGLPTLIPDYIPEGREVVFHSENGILGMGPVPAKDELDTWLINATKQNITLLQGASIFHHADSFAIIRGGHLDLCVLGAYEVAENGDIANWATSANDTLPGVGGAMDLAAGSRQLWALMEHVTKDGRPRVVQRCNYPLTASGVVKRVYTNLAVLEVTPKGFEVLDIAPGVTFDALQSKTDAKLHMAGKAAPNRAAAARQQPAPQSWDPLAIVPKR